MAAVSSPAQRTRHLTGVERTFGNDEIIVSKTDTRGCITYANEVFLRVAQYTESELIGKNHNIIRHPAMPRCVFKFLWDTIQAGREIFAYVINRTKYGDYYWVFAHVTPTFDDDRRIVGYHSNRRVPDRQAVKVFEGIYKKLTAVEARHSNPREAWQASLPVLVQTLEQQGMSYDEFIFSLTR